MPITFPCEKCGKSLRVPDDAAGKMARCPACGGASTAPAGDDPVFEVVEKSPTPRPELNPRRDVADDSPPIKLADEALPSRTAKKRRKRRRLGGNKRIDHVMDAASREFRNNQIIWTVLGVLMLIGGVVGWIEVSVKLGGPCIMFGVIFIYVGVTGDFGDEGD